MLLQRRDAFWDPPSQPKFATVLSLKVQARVAHLNEGVRVVRGMSAP